MAEKLSEWLAIHQSDCARAANPETDAVICIYQMTHLASCLAEAARIVKAVEDAPEGEITAGYDGPCAAFAVTSDGDEWMSHRVSKRVKLVESL